MKFAATLLAGLGLAHAAIPAAELRQSQFTSWVKEHNKQYSTEEFFSKFSQFAANMEHIEQHNDSGAGWTMAMNAYGDLSADEFKAKYMGYKQVRSEFIRSLNYAPIDENFDAPDSVDWRTKGAVTPVKDQGQCGSCWAFSTIGSTEGAYQLAGNDLTQFSEQQLVDCATPEGNQGCNGGLMDYGFEFIIKNGGSCKEDDYSYTAKDGTCKKSCSAVKSITGYKDVTAGSEKALKQAVAGAPVSIAIEADQSAFQFYSGGVMDGKCGKQLDHGVLLVGYGTDSGQDYWLVKNSWGKSWGESGYIRLSQGKDQCGIADAASYPTM